MKNKNIEEEELNAEEKLSTGTRKNSKKSKKGKNKVELKDETRHSIWGVFFFVLGLFIVLSIFNVAGVAGKFFYKTFSSVFGLGYYVLPILLVLVGISFMRTGKFYLARLHLITGILAILSSLGIMDIAVNGAGHSENIFWGGYFGSGTSWLFVKIFGTYASILILGAILITSLIVLFDEKPNLLRIWKRLLEILKVNIPLKNWFRKNNYELPITNYELKEDEIHPDLAESQTAPQGGELEESGLGEVEGDFQLKTKNYKLKTTYTPPPLELLERDKGKPNVGDVKANMNIIQRTLLNFGISVEMDEVTIGPTITRYALKPAQGVKLSRIVGLQNDLALALAAHPIRIEAPIPGKSLVGIEGHGGGHPEACGAVIKEKDWEQFLQKFKEEIKC